jgi:hypothetical protein
VSALTIPKRYREGVLKISQLDDRTVQALRSVLDSVPVSEDLSPKSMLSAASALAKDEVKSLRPVAEALFALYRVKVSSNVTSSQFVDDITEAMEEGEHSVSTKDRERLHENLRALLGAESFTLLSKVRNLQIEDERVFCSARILTDLRPVFGVDVEAGPKAMIVVHKLKLGYHEARSNSHDEIHISLDASDLRTLKDVVDRAMEKAKALQQSERTLPLFGVESAMESE